jgi:hypothetical protein
VATTGAPEPIPEGRPGNETEPATTLPPVVHDTAFNCNSATVNSATRANISITFVITLKPQSPTTTAGFPPSYPSPYLVAVSFQQQNGFREHQIRPVESANGGTITFTGSLPGADPAMLLFVSGQFANDARCNVDFMLSG